MDVRSNPWAADTWNLTDQGRFVKLFGPAVAARRAAEVGAKLGDLRPRVTGQNKIFIIQGKRGSPGTAGADGADGQDGSASPILGFTAEGPFVAFERFALAPTPVALRFPSSAMLLSTATALFRPTADRVFVLTTDPDEYLANGDAVVCTVTFVLGSQIGAFAWNGTSTIPVNTTLYIIGPPVADPVLGGVQILFRGDKI